MDDTCSGHGSQAASAVEHKGDGAEIDWRYQDYRKGLKFIEPNTSLKASERKQTDKGVLHSTRNKMKTYQPDASGSQSLTDLRAPFYPAS